MALQFLDPLRKRWKLIRAILVAYVIVGVALYFLQEKFLFHPTKIDADAPLNITQSHEELTIPVTEEKLVHITRFTTKDSVVRGTVLYFHGNRDNVERYAPATKIFTQNGYEVWMPDYPGFGKSTGERTEETMKQDAELVFKLLRSRFAADSIIIYGRSLGSGPASWLASRVDCKRLILETPYSSITDLMQNYAFIYPVSWMAKYEFDNKKCLPGVDAPISIFHGTSDRIIPLKLARRLANVVPGNTELIEIEGGGHNNLREYPVYNEFISSYLK